MITAGGDFGAATPFATVPGYPTSLQCSPTEVLVATLTAGTFLGEVYDITAGGDAATPIATGFDSSYGPFWRTEAATVGGQRTPAPSSTSPAVAT